jgi:hypothetical protein
MLADITQTSLLGSTEHDIRCLGIVLAEAGVGLSWLILSGICMKWV